MVHGFSGVNQPVGQGYGNADGLTAGQLINDPAANGAGQVEDVRRLGVEVESEFVNSKREPRG